MENKKKRKEALERFTVEMDKVLDENSYKGGWKQNKDDGFLEKKLIEEMVEFFLSLNHPSWTGLNVIREFINQYNYASGHVDITEEGQKKELVDIGNICMMLYDNL